MRWVTAQAAVDLGTPLMQLTSDAARTDAHRFYTRLGSPRMGSKHARGAAVVRGHATMPTPPRDLRLSDRPADGTCTVTL